MKILHIIPGAFHYFDDIKSKAFALMDDLQKWGVECESSTIMYGTWTKSEEASVETAAPGMRFQAMGTLAETLQNTDEFDAVHLHVPLLGEADTIIAWKKQNPTKPLIVTWYRPVKISTIFSLFIRAFNWFYLPKLFSLATCVAYADLDDFIDWGGGKRLAKDQKQVVVDSSSTFMGNELDLSVFSTDLTPPEAVAYKYILLYNTFTSH